MSKKRVEFKFYLDIEGTDKDIRKVIRETVQSILFDFEDYEPLIEPYQWRNLEGGFLTNDLHYSPILNEDLLESDF